MIGQYPKAEVAPFSSAEIGIRKSVLKTDIAVNRRVNLMPNSGRRSRTVVFRTVVDVIRCIKTAAEIPREKRKKSWTRR